MRVRLIGYWCYTADGSPDEDGPWPDPRALIDESWSSQERELVASYRDWAAEYADRVSWPEGVAFGRERGDEVEMLVVDGVWWQKVTST